MKFKNIAMVAFYAGLTVPAAAGAAETDLQQKLDSLSKEVESLKQQVDQTKKKSLGQWLSIGGDYRFRYDYLRGDAPSYFQLNPNNAQADGSDLLIPASKTKYKNDALYTNRFGLDLKAKATQDVTVTARLLMYKISGAQDDTAIRGNNGNQAFFSDRAGIFDGTIGHVPSDSKLAVDRVYATWNNIAGQPVWFSIGRRPSTGGIPTHLKSNTQHPGVSGVPQLLVDYAFDGVTLGYAPEIESLPGAYAKICYGRGFENGITPENGNSLHDTDMIGLNVVPYDTDKLRVQLQYNRAMNIFDTPNMLSGPFAGARPSVQLGDIDWFGLDFLGAIKEVGIGTVNWFAAGALSKTHANKNTMKLRIQTPVDFDGPGPGAATDIMDTQSGLLFTGTPKDSTGWSVYAGTRYDIEQTGTKLGFEFNHGSKNWITFAPAADDMWTSKVGTRGNVYEGYVIQELKLKPISSYISKTFFKIGYQYYDFDYTGSNNWVGAPVKITDAMSQANPQMMTPLKSAQNIYATFEVKF